MNVKGKKLLILAGSDVHCKVVEAAKELGVYTIVTDYLQDSPAKKIADESLMYSITDVEGIVDYCCKNHIDGVLNFCNDTAQIPYQQICEKMHYYCFCNNSQVLQLSNKKLFKELCIKNNIDIIPEYTEEDCLYDRNSFPVIVKPVDSRGSRGVSSCKNKEELITALQIARKESKTHNIIIEKSMYGKQDFTITYFFVSGKPYLIRIGDRYLGKTEYGLDRQCCCLVAPSKYENLYLNKIDKKMQSMLINLGITNGPVFMQGFFDGEVLRVYDPGIRFPGGDYERVYRDVIGVDFMKAMVQFALTGQMDVDISALDKGYHLNGLSSIQIVLNAKAGTIKSFAGLDEVAKLDGVIYIMQKAFPGEIILNTGDVKQQIGEIGILISNNLQSIQNTIDIIFEKIRVVDEEGNNMLLKQINCGDFAFTNN